MTVSTLPVFENTTRAITRRRGACKKTKNGNHAFKARGKKGHKYQRCAACAVEKV